MSNIADRQTPLVPHVLYARGAQDRPYTISPIERCTVVYHTATTVRITTSAGARSVPQAHVWALPDDVTWNAVQAQHAQLQAALTALRTELEDLGSYMQRRDERGADAPNPICSTVIGAATPEREYVYLGDHWYVPRVVRHPITRHTAKMLWVNEAGRYGPVGASGWWYCPDDDAWQRVRNLHTGAVGALQAFEHVLQHKVGMYQDIARGAALAAHRRAA